MNKLHPGTKWHFRLGALVAFIPLAFVAVYIFSVLKTMAGVFDDSGVTGISSLISIFFIAIPVALILIILFAEIYARLSYKYWKYEFGATNVKLERGIIWKKYSNIPYERVQNVDISRGIIARIFGFSTVDLQTAGATYAPRGKGRSEGHIPGVGVKHAEEIREFVMGKISRRGSGV